jgi:hypothetical protein
VPVSLGWFTGGYDPPAIRKTAYYWYAFAILKMGRYRADHYFICDYLQMREWVLAFTAPLGNTHRDHADWRSDLRRYPGEEAGYFRWGDEPAGMDEQPERVFAVDNLAAIATPPPAGQHAGGYGAGGESAAHKLLKLYVAGHPARVRPERCRGRSCRVPVCHRGPGRRDVRESPARPDRHQG